MSAVGTYTPSMFIFPKKRMVDALLNGSPPGSIGHCSSKWVDISLFMRWLVHFQSQVNATLEKKVLLILDDHASQISLAAINSCRERNIMLSIPPSTSPRLRPLDCTFFRSLKTYYDQEIEKW